MSWFLNKKVGTKLIIAFSAVLALTMTLGVFAIDKLASVRATTVDMADNWLQSITSLNDMRFALSSARRFELRGILSKATEERETNAQSAETELGNFKKAEAVYEPTIVGADEKKIYDDVQAAFQEYSNKSAEAAQLARQGKLQDADQRVMADKEIFDKAAAAIQKDIDYNKQGAHEARELSTQLYTMARNWSIGLLIGCVALGLMLAMWIARLISRPVSEVAEVAKRIATGDLTGSDLHISSRDEIGDLAESINGMQRNLRDTIASVCLECRADRYGQRGIFGYGYRAGFRRGSAEGPDQPGGYGHAGDVFHRAAGL